MSAGPVDGTPAGQVAQHYSSPGRAELVLARTEQALTRAGRRPSTLTFRDVAAFDQYHSRGREATMELAELAGVREGMSVLDVGGGVGGPARLLAGEFGCRVTVLDLTEDFTRAGEILTERVGLSDRVRFHTGNALNMPFDSGSFDLVWTQHASMNIEDKERLYAEIHRVLRPGGRLALHDMMAGERRGAHYPVMWASTPDISFLRKPEEVRALITATGFRELAWVDVTQVTLEWFRKRREAERTSNVADDPLAVRLDTVGANVLRNLEEGRLACIEAVFEKV